MIFFTISMNDYLELSSIYDHESLVGTITIKD